VVGAIAFYTIIPIPKSFSPEFLYVSRVAPLIGGMIGLILWSLDIGLHLVGMPILTRSALIIVAWMIITGGLHLDGAMDTADGLAVMNPERRLEVMADSRSGAFGVMMAIALVILKVAALSEILPYRGLWLILAATWGRWGQQMAIAHYPYLKETGKGAFHKAALSSSWAWILSALGLWGVHCLWIVREPDAWVAIALAFLAGGAIALAVGYWLYRRLGGHTGDTYGAVVEITETLLLIIAGVLTSRFSF
jgi:adenosylcobinamide-GDP ribazoletransferase